MGQTFQAEEVIPEEKGSMPCPSGNLPEADSRSYSRKFESWESTSTRTGAEQPSHRNSTVLPLERRPHPVLPTASSQYTQIHSFTENRTCVENRRASLDKARTSLAVK